MKGNFTPVTNTVEISFLAGELIFTAIWLTVRIIVWINHKKIDIKREAMLLLMYVNLAVIIRFVFYPMALVNGRVQPLVFDTNAIFPLKVNFIPYIRLSDYAYKKDLLVNLIGNIAMFIPTGIILPVLYRRLNNFFKAVAVGALISLCIEILQLPFSARFSDIDDLILNTVGVAIGYGVYALVKFLRKAVKKRSE